MTANPLRDLEPQLAENRRFWAGWAGSDPDTDLPIYRSDVPYEMFNGVLRVRDRSLDRAVAEAKRALAGSPWVWWVGEDSDDGVAEGLSARGAEQIRSMPVMAVDLTAVRPRPLPDGLAIVPVVDSSAVPEFVRLYAAPFALPEESVDKMIEHELHDVSRSPDVVRLAGVVDGKMVATAVVTLGPHVAGLFCVKTAEFHRRGGIGAALTLEALKIAREAGCRIASLQATPAGQAIYERLGFETVSHYRVFRFPT